MRRLRSILGVTSALVLLLTGGLPSSAAALGGARTTLTVVADRLAYVDGSVPASFDVVGACVRRGSVRFDQRSCGEGASSARGTVSSAWLGFDVVRDAEVLPADVPVTRTTHQAARDHLEIARVDLHEPGELVVKMTAHERSELSPRVVKGSAKPRGSYTRSSVEWRVGAAEPGTYEFSAVFRPRAPQPAIGYFMPQLEVWLVRATDDALPSAVASAPAAGATLTSVLRLRQHEAAGYGTPRMGDHGRFGGSPDAWVTPVYYEAQGNYHSGTGRISHASVTRFALGERPNTASMGYGTRHWLGIPKIDGISDFLYSIRDRELVLHGFKTGIRTVNPGGDSWFFVPEPLGGTIFDGDSQSIAIGATAATVTANEKREPSRPGGSLVVDWDGRYSEAWGSFDEHRTPDAPSAASATLHREASVPVVSRGGDIDNREGSRPIKAKPLLIDVPDGEFGFIGIGMAAPGPSKFDPTIRFTRSGHLEVVPRIMPGGYLLESTGFGLARDWAANLSVSVTVFAPETEHEGQMQRSFLFPPDASASITIADTRGLIRRFDAGPGIWRAVAGADGIAVERIGGLLAR